MDAKDAMPRDPIDIEELLGHQRWLKRLAGGLVADPGAADDVVQDVWITALRHPPAREGSVFGWLARVARSRLADRRRSEGRRAAREAAAAAPAPSPSAADLAAQAETCRAVAQAVFDLPEPIRGTVLLRFYHDLPLKEVAKRSGVPLETIRTRLRRALATLRGRLDRDLGDRAGWSGVLLAFAGPPSPDAAGRGASLLSTLAVGALVMTTKLKIVAAAALALLFGAGTLLLLPDGKEPAALPVRSAEAPLPAAAPVPTSPAEDADSAREPAAAPGAEPSGESAAAAPTVPADTVQGAVRLEDGTSPAGTKVLLTWRPPGPGTIDRDYRHFDTEAGPSGRFRLDGIRAGSCRLKVTRDGYTEAEVGFDQVEGRGHGPVEVVLRPAGTLLVRVTDAEGKPAQYVKVEVKGPEDEAWTLARRGRDRTDHLGTLRLEHVPPGTYGARLSGESGAPFRVAEVAPGKTAEIVLAMALADLVGEVRDADGAVVVDALVTIDGRTNQHRFVRTDASGRFAFAGLNPGEVEVRLQVLKPVRFSSLMGRVELSAGEAVDLPIRVPAPTVTGTIRRSDTGAPVTEGEGVVTAYRVELDDEGNVKQTAGLGAMGWPGADGRYVLAGLEPGTWRLTATAHDKSLKPAPRIVVVPESGTLEDMDFLLEAQRVGTLRLRILDPTGKGAPRAQITVRSGTRASGGGYREDEPGGIYVLRLAPGKHAVEIFVSGCHLEQIEVTIEEGQVLDREVRTTEYHR